MRVISVLLLVAVCAQAAKDIPFAYPLFKQCDPAWGDDLMVTETICQVGCLMSSVSMALNGKGIKINGISSNPGVLNTWLQQNGGYDADNDLYEEVIFEIAPNDVAYLGPYYNNTSLSPQTLKVMLLNELVVIANVMNGGHFVLMTGFNDDLTQWYVNDPGFDKDYYLYDDIVGYRVFVMADVKDQFVISK
mmetsp:Transcript_5707/g.7986  ORF Transcript_5707/g.7986 Transcript_5707/m.7986 type:complete len:191 (-) Transcript_5707:61-633(-)